MSFSVNFPNINPSLMIDFVNRNSLDSRVTFTRGSTATFFNSSGVLSTANNNVARFDYDPSTLQPQGLLIEEQRTNSIRNNTMQGAVAGTPGTIPTNWTLVGVSGVSSSVIGTGTEDGISYIDIQVNGTPTASSFINIVTDTGIAASSGQTWTCSSYFKLQAGSLSNTSCLIEIREVNSGGGFLVNSTQTFVPTSAALKTQKSSLSRTLNNASTTNVRFLIDFQTTNGAAIDITLRIGLPQLEQGAFATSVIPTTTTALTRNADAASMTGTNFSDWYNASEGTLYVDFQTRNPQIDAVPVTANDGTNNNRIGFDITSTGFGREVVTDGGSGQALIGSAGLVSGAFNKMALVYKVNDFAISKNGGAVDTDTSGTIPSVNQLSIGSRVSALNLNGTIRSIRYYTVRLPDSTLQALTA